MPLWGLWILALILISFRRDISLLWKISILLIFVFYTIFFWEDIIRGWNNYKNGFFTELLHFLFRFLELVPLLLLLNWPVVLLIAYNNSNSRNTERILCYMVLITLFYWLFWISTKYIDSDTISKSWSVRKIMQGVRLIKIPDPP